MRVLHLCHVPLTPDHPDFGKGYNYPGRWVVSLAKAQKAHTPIEPLLCTVVPGASADFHTTVDGLPVWFLRASPRLRAATGFRAEIAAMRRLCQSLNPALVHAHGTEESYALAAQKTGRPYVITLQGVLGIINRVTPPPLLSRARWIELLERHALRRARDVVTKSRYIETRIRRMFPHLRTWSIPNTLDDALLEAPVPEKTPAAIAFVGTVTYRKGVDLLADALSLPPLAGTPVTLHIFGNAPTPATEYERDVLNRLRQILRSRLILHGVLPSAQCAREAAKSPVLAAPSREEMFGNQVIEALAGGSIPVVSSDTAMAETVQNAGAGRVFNNGDPRDLSEQLHRALFRDPLPDPAAIRQRLREIYGPETVARQHLNLYQRLLTPPA